MNLLMPDAPAPVASAGGMGAPPGQGPPVAAAASMGPQPSPGPPAPPPTPEQIKTARTHIGAIVEGLRELVAKPRGDLTKKDVFDGASEMIAKGAFPTPESKQELIVRLAGLPDDEPGIRKALGGMLLQASQVQAGIHQIHGPG